MQRPAVEVVWRTLCAGLMGVAFLGVCDLLYARHTKARWFALHAAVNFVIAACCLPDLVQVARAPLCSMVEPIRSWWPSHLAFALHLYHLLAFTKMRRGGGGASRSKH